MADLNCYQKCFSQGRVIDHCTLTATYNVNKDLHVKVNQEEIMRNNMLRMFK